MISALPVLLSLALPAGVPIYFEANVGQAPAEVLVRSQAGSVQVDATRDALSVGGAAIRFDGGRARSVRFEARLEARVRRIGKRGAIEIPSYERAVLESVWPGIDVVLLSRDGRLAFDLVVAPGADPSRAGLTFDGEPSVDPDSGGLIVKDARGVLALSRPIALQGRRVEAGFTVSGRRAGVHVGAYDPSRPLIIDPVVEYASYVPGNGSYRIASVGPFIYLARSLNAGTQPADPELFVAKIDPRLTGAASLIWATSYDGNNSTAGIGSSVFVEGLDVTASERVLVCGSQGGGGPRGVPFADSDDANAPLPRLGVGFATVIAPAGGAIEHVSSFSDSGITHCKFDLAGDTFYTTGRSDTGPPGTSQIPNMTGWGYLVQIDPNDDPAIAGDDLAFTSRLGINSTIGYRMAIDPSGNVVLLLATSNQTGPDVDQWVDANSFQTTNDEIAVCKFATALGANALLGCTYLGGTGGDRPGDVTTDAAGNIYLYGYSGSADFPTSGPTPVEGGPFVARLSPDLGTLDFTYFLPMNAFSRPTSVALLDDGSIVALDNYFGGSSWPFTSCVLHTDNVGSNFVVLDSVGQNVVFGTRLSGIFGSSLAALPDARVAIAGSVFANTFLAPHINGYETTSTGDGLMVLSVRETCLDLALSGQSSTNLPTRGDEVRYTFDAINNGPDVAGDVTLQIAIPALLDLVEIRTSAGSCTATVAGSASCTFGDLASTASATIELTTIASSTGAALIGAEVDTIDIDLDATNDAVMLGVSVGPPAGPCGPVSIYGVCSGDLLRICLDRNTASEMLVETDCAATNESCAAAVGTTAAHCEPAAVPDAGTLDGGSDQDAASGEDGSVGADGSTAKDTGIAAADSGVRPDAGEIENNSDGCDCSTSGTSGGGQAGAGILFGLALVAILRRRTR